MEHHVPFFKKTFQRPELFQAFERFDLIIIENYSHYPLNGF